MVESNLKEEGTGFYTQVENKFYDVMDSVEKMGVPVYKVIDAIEANGVPAFPVFLIISLILVLGIGFLVSGIVFPSGQTIQVIVEDYESGVLSGASVEASYEDIVLTGTTDSDGLVEFKVPLEKEISFTVSKKGYESNERTKTFFEANEVFKISLSKKVTSITKTITLTKSNGEAFEDTVTLRAECLGEGYFDETITVIDGSANINVPSDCGNLKIVPINDDYLTDETSFDEGENSIVIEFSEREKEFGSVLVTVTDEDGNPVEGITVYLKDASSLTEIDSGSTFSTGSVEFDSVPSGEYFVTTFDSSEVFGEYNGLHSGEVKQVSQNTNTVFDIVLTKKVVGKISLKVKDKKTGENIENALVKLMKENQLLFEDYTNEYGEVSFGVGENVEYSVTIDKPNYLIETKTNITPSEETQTIYLTMENNSNINSLKVTVLDEKREPIQNAKIRLYDYQSNLIGLEKTSGEDGVVLIEGIEPGDYYIKAIKPGFGESDLKYVNVLERQENKVNLTIPIGFGKIVLNVLDNEKQPVSGAKVNVYDYESKKIIQKLSNKLTEQGIVEVEARADKKIYLEVIEKNYAPFITTPIQMEKDVTIRKEIELESNASKLELKFDGLFVDEAMIGDSIEPGQSYKAKFRLILPSGVNVKQAGFHLRAGSDNSKEMEKDGVYFSSINSAVNEVRKGTSYNPPKGYGIDAQHFTTGDAKWVEGIIKNPKPGVYEIEAMLQVKDSAVPESIQELHYRAWTKTGSYNRYPTDSELGSSESTANKQALYARTNTRPLTVGSSNYCYENFCIQLNIENKEKKIKTPVNEKYSAKISNDYKLNFTITSISEQIFNQAEISILNETKSIELGNYTVNKINGETKTGTVNEENEMRVKLNSIKKDNQLTGSIEFKPEEEGTSAIELSILSEGEKVFVKEILIETQQAKKMKVEIIPKTIIPLIKNNVLIKATDENTNHGVKARVKVTVNEEPYTTGTTNRNGAYAFELNPVKPGTIIKIILKSPGYKPVEKKMIVTENIINVKPESLKETLTLGQQDTSSTELILENLSFIPLKIESIEFSGTSDYLNAGIEEGTIGKIIESNEDTNTTIYFSLTPKAITLTKPTIIAGDIILKVGKIDSNTWVTRIPFEVRINFGGEVLEPTCFNVDPVEWKINTNTEKKETEITLNNNCETNENPTDLFNIQARIKTSNENKIGEFKIKTKNKEIKIGEKWVTINGLIKKQKTMNAMLEFKPDEIPSGEGEYTLEFQATNKTSEGEEKLKTSTKITASVNNLLDCVEILNKKQIIIESCPYNTGYGFMGEYFPGMIPGQPFNPRFDYRNSTVGYGAKPYWMQGGRYNNNYYRQPAYPNTQYNYPFYNSDYRNPTMNNQWVCGKSTIQIRNNCTKTVKIDTTSEGPQIIIDDAETTIEPGEETTIGLQAAYMIGKYQVTISGKFADSKQKTTELKKLDVIIESEEMKTYEDCISVEPVKTIKFNEFLPKAKPIKIINSCYDSGIIIKPRGDSIEFTTSNLLNPSDRTTPAGEPNPRMSENGLMDNPVISSWRYVNQSLQRNQQGKTTQELVFEIIPNTSFYHKEAPKLLRGGKTLAQIGNIRYFITSGYYAINMATELIVKFQSPRTGLKREARFPYIIQDYWKGTGYLDNLINQGDETTLPRDCITQKTLDFTEKGCIEINELQQGIQTNNLWNTSNTILNPKTNKYEEQGCGTTDKITKINALKYSKPIHGLKFTIKTTNHGHDIKILADPTNWNGKPINMNEKIKLTIHRNITAKTETITIPLKIKVCEQENYNPTTTTTTNCENGKTGENTYKKYGLNKLLFTWKNINKDTCDKYTNTYKADEDKEENNLHAGFEENKNSYFCDGIQTKKALEKKEKILNEYLNNKINSQKLSELIKEKEPKEWITKLIKTIEIDNTSYYLSNDKKIIIEDTPPTVSNLEQVKNADLSKQTAVTLTLNNFSTIMNSLRNNLKNILIIINSNNTYNTTLTSLGAVKTSDGMYYILNGVKYKAIHNACENASGTTCTVSNTSVSVDLLQFIYNNSIIVYGKQVKEKLTDTDLKELMINGALKVSLPSGYNNFYEFYNDVIAPVMYLKKENYTTNLIPNINSKNVDSPGAFEVVNNLEKISINEFETIEELDDELDTSYSSNKFLWLPFDAVEKSNAGLSYAGEVNGIFLNNDGENSIELESIDNSNSSNSLNVNYSSEFSDLQEGRVLSVSNSEMVYSPSEPVVVKAKINCKEDEECGFAYELLHGLAGNYEKIDSNPWVTNGNEVVNDETIYLNEFCENKSSKAKTGVIVEDNTNLTKTIYLPPKAMNSTRIDEKEYVLNLIGGKNTTISITNNINDSTTNHNINCRTSSKAININSYQQQVFMKTEHSIQKIVEKVKEQKMCVKEENEELSFYWNS